MAGGAVYLYILGMLGILRSNDSAIHPSHRPGQGMYYGYDLYDGSLTGIVFISGGTTDVQTNSGSRMGAASFVLGNTSLSAVYGHVLGYYPHRRNHYQYDITTNSVSDAPVLVADFFRTAYSRSVGQRNHPGFRGGDNNDDRTKNTGTGIVDCAGLEYLIIVLKFTMSDTIHFRPDSIGTLVAATQSRAKP